MKINLLTLSAALIGAAPAAGTANLADTKRKTAAPVQRFYIPIPEHEVFDASFKPTNSRATGPVTSIISLAISTNDTVVWWDHWEDGYDADVLTSMKKTTQVWGDKDISNGCAFGSPCLKPEDDILVAGQSIVIENDVPLDHHTKKASMLFDAKDKILASFHIAITRGSYPKYPGSYMAGAVEVHDTGSWGKFFEAPFGNKLTSTSDATRISAYEKTVLFFMAYEDDTKLFAGGNAYTLGEGDSKYVIVDQGDVVTTSKPVQADIVTSDLGSTYELRWYSLLANEYWSDKYLTPMGDSTANTRVVVYNPESNKLTINVFTNSKRYNIEVPGKSSKMTEPIKTGEGAVLTSTSGKRFIAMSQTDTVSSGDNNDWGFPLVPYNQLTTQVLIGWGYGCKGKTCSGKNRLNQDGSRSVVYVSCVEDCDIYVDVNNDGQFDEKFSNVKAISSTRIVDKNDHDMSGAIIWATKVGKGPSGTPVQITSAWGQDPERSYGGDQEAMDLGTVVLPFGTVKVSETVKLVGDSDGNGVISAGDVLQYTIRIQNNGQIDILPGQLVVKGPIEPQALTQRQYSQGSCLYSNMVGSMQKCTDDSLGSAGLKNPYKLPKHGGFHDITFNATIDDITKITTNKLPQFGRLYYLNQAPLPFSVDSTMLFSADIKLLKTIHIGDVSCLDATKGLSDTDAKLVTAAPGTGVTYCYRIVNTGKSFLMLRNLNDPDLKFGPDLRKVLEPQKLYVVKLSRSIGTKPANSIATIYGNPVYTTGVPIPGMDDVNDDDAAGFDILYPDADVKISKTVHNGHWATCSTGRELVTGYNNDLITYCYEVENTGGTSLKDFTIFDPLTGYRSSGKIPLLKPGQKFMLPGFKTALTKTIVAEAKVTALPAHDNGAAIPGMSAVTDKDPAGVRLIAKQILPCLPDGSLDPDWAQPAALSKPDVLPVPDQDAPKAFTIAKPSFASSNVANSFRLKQNTFRQTIMGFNMASTSYDAGQHALKLRIGNHCSQKTDCTGTRRGMSGGYSYLFKLAAPGTVKITFLIKGYNSKENDKGEDGYGYVSMDGKILGPETYFLDGDKHDDQQGWKTIVREVKLAPGEHEMICGGYFTERSATDEHVTFLIKDFEMGYLP